jgi:hypothetical protein
LKLGTISEEFHPRKFDEDFCDYPFESEEEEFERL